MQMLRDMAASIRAKVSAATARIKAKTYSELRAAGPGFLEVGRSWRGSGWARHKNEGMEAMMHRLQGTRKQEVTPNGH